MKVYADSSFLVKLFTSEPESPAVVAEYRRLSRPYLYFTPLHAVEVENAIIQRAFFLRASVPSGERRQITRERDEAIARMNRYLSSGRLQQISFEEETFAEAQRLSRLHTDRLGVRAIDLLHVANALILKAELFLTTDQRQLKLATAEGLTASSIV